MATSKSKSPSKRAPRTTDRQGAKALAPRLTLREKLPPASLATKRRRAREVFARLARLDPDPRCELYYRTPFQLLVSVVLSAQTTDKMVNACMQPVYEQGFGVDDAIRLGADGLLPIIRRIGFAPTKARHVARLAGILKEKHGGEVPRSREELEALPGVGRKTANVVLAEIWREPTLAVDTHVFRVGRRLGFHDEPTPDRAEQALLQVIDAELLPAAHHWLILHGRYTCKALRPACERCVLNDICPSYGPLPK